MEWSFEFSLMVFLVIAFVSQAVSALTKSKLSLPFVLGVICIAGFALNIFPKDFVEKSKLIEVGTIAFNVLIIHSGTMFDYAQIKRSKKTVVLVFSSVLIMTAVVVLGLMPLIGKQLALIAPSSMIGGGAACAIGSIGLLKKFPQFSAFPWLAFMFQSFFSVPLFAVMLKKTKVNNMSLENEIQKNSRQNNKKKAYDRIPPKYRTPAFYLGVLMVISVINRWFHSLFLADWGVPITLSALIAGIVLGQLGVVERAPLKNSDSFGLLMIGLMSLLANSFAHTPFNLVLSLLPPLLLCFAVCTVVLAVMGILLGKRLGFDKNSGVFLTISSMIPYPINTFVIRGIYSDKPNDDNIINSIIEKSNIGSLYVVNIFSVLLVSVMLIFI